MTSAAQPSSGSSYPSSSSSSSVVIASTELLNEGALYLNDPLYLGCRHCKVRGMIEKTKGGMHVCMACAAVEGCDYSEYEGYKSDEDENESSNVHVLKQTCTSEQASEHQGMKARVMRAVMSKEDRRSQVDKARLRQADVWYEHFFLSTKDPLVIMTTYLPLSEMKLSYMQRVTDYLYFMPTKSGYDRHTYAACLLLTWERSPLVDIWVDLKSLAEQVIKVAKSKIDTQVMSAYKDKEQLFAANPEEFWVTLPDGWENGNVCIPDFANRAILKMLEKGETKIGNRFIDPQKFKEFQQNQYKPTKEEKVQLGKQEDNKDVSVADKKIRHYYNKLIHELNIEPLTRIEFITKYIHVFASKLNPRCDESDWKRIIAQSNHVYRQMQQEEAAKATASQGKRKAKEGLLACDDTTIAATILQLAFINTSRNGGKFTKNEVNMITGVANNSIRKCERKITTKIGLALTEEIHIKYEEEEEEEEESAVVAAVAKRLKTELHIIKHEEDQVDTLRLKTESI